MPGDRWSLDASQYTPGQRAGHYESFYQRANHPTRPLAFWIRYTIFAPAGDPRAAIGELWAVVFDGESGEHAVARTEVPIAECWFDNDEFQVRIGPAELGPDAMLGTADQIGWNLRYRGDSAPLLLLPARLYRGSFPNAKSLVPLPLARYSGRLTVASREIEVDDWVGSQNHNWGSRHTDRYAFAQVAGFDDAPDSFLEAATAKARLAGPFAVPWTTFVVLRHNGVEHAITTMRQAITATGSYRYFAWEFATRDEAVSIRGRVHAEREDFVGLSYRNPPGGRKQCLNTKIAAAEVSVRDRNTGHVTRLRTANRALFEILTDDDRHGVALRA